jgi:hypothetical protein
MTQTQHPFDHSETRGSDSTAPQPADHNSLGSSAGLLLVSILLRLRLAGGSSSRGSAVVPLCPRRRLFSRVRERWRGALQTFQASVDTPGLSVSWTSLPVKRVFIGLSRDSVSVSCQRAVSGLGRSGWLSASWPSVPAGADEHSPPHRTMNVLSCPTPNVQSVYRSPLSHRNPSSADVKEPTESLDLEAHR